MREGPGVEFMRYFFESAFLATQTSEIYRTANDSYKVYKIRQGKRGKLRTIEEPSPKLKAMQKKCIGIFEDHFDFSGSCTAMKGSSAADNAAQHQGAKHILKIDVKNCYQSIKYNHVWESIDLYVEHPNVKDIMLDILNMCTYNRSPSEEAHLPTGAPTSPTLCNVALTPLDFMVLEMLEKEYPGKYTYTRYLDDLIISTKEETRDWEIKDKIENMLKDMNLRPHPTKCKWLTNNKSDNCVVTGVRIKEKNTVQREFRRTVRARLQNLAKAGSKIDAETQGCLAYIKSIDQQRYDSLLQYYERRKIYVSANGKRTSP